MHGGPIIRHLDDVPAEEMSRFRYADGRTASVWEKGSRCRRGPRRPAVVTR